MKLSCGVKTVKDYCLNLLLLGTEIFAKLSNA